MDVALWQQYREFHGKPTVTDATDFVIVNPELHNEFDLFKKENINPSYSYIPINELLLYYCRLSQSNVELSSKVTRFGRDYLELHVSQVDLLISWASEMRKQYKSEGKIIFENGIQSLFSNNGLIIIIIIIIIITRGKNIFKKM